MNIKTMISRGTVIYKTKLTQVHNPEHVIKYVTRYLAAQSKSDQPVEMENPYTTRASRCLLCGVKIDYKNVQLLSQFVSPYTGLQTPKKLSGLCDRKFDEVKQNIRVSRRSGFMPTQYKETIFVDDPNIIHTNYGPKEQKSYKEMSNENV